jgi:hypothetical protein
MKKNIIIIFLFFCSGYIGAAEYPNVTMEQVNFSPATYEGMTLKFNNSWFNPSPAKETKFGEPIYGVMIKSPNGTYYSSLFYGDQITFYLSNSLAAVVVNAGLSTSSYYSANITCTVEKIAYLPYTWSVPQVYWLCRIVKIETLSVAGNIRDTFADGDMELPKYYTQQEFNVERARWDANGDNKIGLEEAIRALQIVSGMR